MIGILLKKQLTEIFRSYFYNSKKNVARPKGTTIAFFLLFVLLMVGVIGGMFGYLSWSICGPLAAASVPWLYFIILGLLAILFGTFGSVFNTYSGLYLGKDNDLLLSMPIPVRAILISRLLGVYLMGLMYSSMACLPALIVHWIVAGPTVSNVAGGLLWMLLISLIVLILSCVLGWVVARISVKLKNRSFVTVLLSLLFIGLYYFFYFKAQTLIRTLIENAALYGDRIRGSARILYAFGKAGAGDWLSLLGMTAVILLVLALIWYVLNRSFLRIATATSNTAKAKYREKPLRQRSVYAALLGREFSRFTKSAMYMLNCGFGILILLGLGVFLLIKGKTIFEVFNLLLASRPGGVAVLFAALLTMSVSMIDPVAPSVSLEGKNLWILQALPVSPWQALRAKLGMQLLLTIPPLLFASIAGAVYLPVKPAMRVMVVLVSQFTAVMFALSGLALSVKFANLSWTNELFPIKQGASVSIALLGGFAFSAILGGLYFLVGWQVRAFSYLGLCVVLEIAFSTFLYFWLRKRGTELFAAL